MYVNECPFCEKIFRTFNLLEAHMDSGCPMDTDFSNSSMEVIVGSDKEDDSHAAEVRCFFVYT